jgi:hypothetical protein
LEIEPRDPIITKELERVARAYRRGDGHDITQHCYIYRLGLLTELALGAINSI